jgi:hypothetical protein
MKHESIGNPFDCDLRDLDLCIISYEAINVKLIAY